ncbi:hypothetical protein [Streptomyces avermitilis]|uniref:Uncharacterized protein n=1 Tax=Streptomyces avermitilis TaxID=33903 RepID=A0A4D4MGG9_STRAX|nr:hypothetical protein [Streptomyces avermitilis]GDY68475.1 hypothetical protein SAV14893_078680 [Streptomyces avermitilis]GDY71152.1 hypothetical protein SAV31267_006370 [Streptomyces avermitilis]
MINQQGSPRRDFVLADGLSLADVQHVHREALRVLRSAIDAAHLDAYSDEAWPPAVLNSYECALSLAREAIASGARSQRDDLGMGIDIDVRDDKQFGVLADLAPYTINAEGWQGDCLIFSANDTGTSLSIAVTQEQEAALLSRLDARGVSSTALVPLQPQRRRWAALMARMRGARRSAR